MAKSAAVSRTLLSPHSAQGCPLLSFPLLKRLTAGQQRNLHLLRQSFGAKAQRQLTPASAPALQPYHLRRGALLYSLQRPEQLASVACAGLAPDVGLPTEATQRDLWQSRGSDHPRPTHSLPCGL